MDAAAASASRKVRQPQCAPMEAGPYAGASSEPPPSDAEDLTTFYHRPCGCCGQLWTLALRSPHATFDRGACGGCRGSSRVALASAQVTSYSLQQRRLLCCTGARLFVRAGSRHGVSAPLRFEDGARAVAALEGALRPAGGGGPPPPSTALAARATSTRLWTARCAKRRGTFSPRGGCALRAQRPAFAARARKTGAPRARPLRTLPPLKPFRTWAAAPARKRPAAAAAAKTTSPWAWTTGSTCTAVLQRAAPSCCSTTSTSGRWGKAWTSSTWLTAQRTASTARAPRWSSRCQRAA